MNIFEQVLKDMKDGTLVCRDTLRRAMEEGVRLSKTAEYKNAQDLINYLDTLHEMTEDGVIVGTHKWKPAQDAIAGIEAGAA